MPAIQIRPAVDTDIPVLTALEHGYSSDHVWQMDLQNEDGQIGVRFREVRLPRPVRVEYPRSTDSLLEDWNQRSGILVAMLEGQVVAYTSMMQGILPRTTWMTDLAVEPGLRRQGIGSALVLAAMEWASAHRQTRRLVLEMQSKNYPAISLAQKLGFDFCGYNDHYYENQDVAIFFSKWIR